MTIICSMRDRQWRCISTIVCSIIKLTLLLIATYANPNDLLADIIPKDTLDLVDKAELSRRQACRCIDFSEDGTLLIVRNEKSRSVDNIRSWSLTGKANEIWECNRATDHDRSSPVCQLAKKGEAVYYADNQCVYHRDMKDKQSRIVFKLPASPKDQSFIDQILVIPGPRKPTIFILSHGESEVDVYQSDPKRGESGEAVLSIREDNHATAMSLNNDGSMLCVAYVNHRDTKRTCLDIWDVAKKELKRRVEDSDGGICAVKFCPDGRRLVFGTDHGSLVCLNLLTGDRQFKLTVEHSIAEIDFITALNAVVFATRNRGNDPNLFIVDIVTKRSLLNLNADHYGLRCVRVSPDGKSIATSGGEDNVKIWAVDKLLAK